MRSLSGNSKAASEYSNKTAIIETCVLLVKETYQDENMVSIKVDMEGINFKQ